MKTYLLFPLFFLSLLGLAPLAWAQEDSSPSTSTPSQTATPSDALPDDQPEDLEYKQEEDHSAMPGMWTAIDHDAHHVVRESDTFQSKFFNMLLILGLLIGFMILASWALKRLMKTKMTGLNTASNIKVLETRYLSPRATLYLVEIQDKSFLIAESPTAVTYLATLPLEHEPRLP